MNEIQLTKGQVAVIDCDDFESLSKYRWYAMESKWGFYAARHSLVSEEGYPRRTVWMHKEIMHVSIGSPMVVDHINGNRLDNRKSNLRIVTVEQNCQAFRRKSEHKTSRFRGVTFDRSRNLWMAYIHHDGRMRNLGRFSSEEVAAAIYNHYAPKIFGAYASLNQI